MKDPIEIDGCRFEITTVEDGKYRNCTFELCLIKKGIYNNCSFISCRFIGPDTGNWVLVNCAVETLESGVRL